MAKFSFWVQSIQNMNLNLNILIKEAFFFHLKKSRFVCQDTQNDYKPPQKCLRKTCLTGCTNTYIHHFFCLTFKKFKHLYLRNYSANRIEILYGDKADMSRFSVQCSLKLINGLRSYDIVNFLKNVCKESSWRKPSAISLNVLYK